jgi:hypothetical protein
MGGKISISKVSRGKRRDKKKTSHTFEHGEPQDESRRIIKDDSQIEWNEKQALRVIRHSNLQSGNKEAYDGKMGRLFQRTCKEVKQSVFENTTNWSVTLRTKSRWKNRPELMTSQNRTNHAVACRLSGGDGEDMEQT